MRSATAPDCAFGADYYATIYRHYERQNPPYKHAFYRRVIAKLAGNSPARILDVGCAFGGFVASMPETWSRYGIDVSSFAIQEGRAKYPGVQLAAATLDTNPFKGPFDIVTSFDVIEHIQDLENVAGHVRSLVRPEGLFVFVVPTYDGPLGPVVHMLDRDPTHIHKTSRKFWIDWAERHFNLCEWIGMFRMLLPFAPYIHWPSQSLRSVAPAVLIAARRKA